MGTSQVQPSQRNIIETHLCPCQSSPKRQKNMVEFEHRSFLQQNRNAKAEGCRSRNLPQGPRCCSLLETPWLRIKKVIATKVHDAAKLAWNPTVELIASST